MTRKKSVPSASSVAIRDSDDGRDGRWFPNSITGKFTGGDILALFRETDRKFQETDRKFQELMDAN